MISRNPRRKRALGLMFGFVMVIATSVWSAALACGNPLLYAVLFAKYPEARTAYEAELAARQDDLYDVAPFPGQPGSSYHKWSLGRATAALERAVERARTQASERGSGDAVVNLMLADEVYVAQLFADPEKPETLKPLSALSTPPTIDAFTTVNALIALVDGQIEWDEAIKRGLVVAGSDTDTARLTEVLGRL